MPLHIDGQEDYADAAAIAEGRLPLSIADAFSQTYTVFQWRHCFHETFSSFSFIV